VEREKAYAGALAVGNRD